MSSIKGTRFVLGRQISLSSNEGDTYLESLMEASGLPERNIVNLIMASCDQDTCMVDVGANIGYISLIMSLVAPKGKVYALSRAENLLVPQG